MNYEYENSEKELKFRVLYNVKNKDLNYIQNPIKLDTTDYIVINNKKDKELSSDRNLCSICNIL